MKYSIIIIFDVASVAIVLGILNFRTGLLMWCDVMTLSGDTSRASIFIQLTIAIHTVHYYVQPAYVCVCVHDLRAWNRISLSSFGRKSIQSDMCMHSYKRGNPINAQHFSMCQSHLRQAISSFQRPNEWARAKSGILVSCKWTAERCFCSARKSESTLCFSMLCSFGGPNIRFCSALASTAPE